jgi:hypothetical protein
VENGVYRYLFFYGPLLAILVFNTATYILVSKKLHNERKRITPIIDEKSPRGYSIESTFRYFLLVLVFCWIFALINRVQNTLYPTQPIFYLYALQACFTPLQGFLNSIIYGFNDELRAKYREAWRKWKDRLFPKAQYMSIQDEEQWCKHYKETMREYENDEP